MKSYELIPISVQWSSIVVFGGVLGFKHLKTFSYACKSKYKTRMNVFVGKADMIEDIILGWHVDGRQPDMAESNYWDHIQDKTPGQELLFALPIM